MRVRTLALALSTLMVGGILGYAAAAKTYEKTGIVKTVEADSFELDLGKEVWRFYTDAATSGKATLKAGDKVTVTYKQVATQIVSKASTAAKAEKPAAAPAAAPAKKK